MSQLYNQVGKSSNGIQIKLFFAELPAAFDVKEGDAFYALATFVSETGEAMNLVEGERVYVLEWNNADWW